MLKLKKYAQKNQNLTVAFAYFVCILIAFLPLFTGNASVNWDAFDLWLPWKHFIVEELYNGNLPLWNPYHVNGFPQHGDSMTWYPISWIFGFLNGTYNLNALNYEFIFHVFIAGFGFYYCTKNYIPSSKIRFVLGLSYMFSGFMIGNAQHISWIISAAWIPWVFYYLNLSFNNTKLRPLLLFSLTSFFLFSGGYLAIFFVVLYLITALIIFKIIKLKSWKTRQKTVLKLILSLFLIFLLSLPLLYSAIQIFPLFNRASENLGNFNLSTGSTPWNGILAIILPFASGIYHVNEIEFGTFSAYFGFVPILILFIYLSRIVKDKKLSLLFCLAVFFLMCSMGNLLPFRKLLANLPLLDLFRYPTLFRLFFIIFFLLLAGKLLEQMQINENLKRKLIILFLLGTSILLLIISLIYFSKIESSALKLYLKHIFSQRFLADLDLNTRIFVNIIVLTLLSFLATIVCIFKKNIKICKSLLILWSIEVIFVATTSAAHSVYHPVNVNFANKCIDYQAKNYPAIDKKHQENELEEWRNYLDFSWQGKTLYLKQFSKNWYNPLKIQHNYKKTFHIPDATLNKFGLFTEVEFDLQNRKFKGDYPSEIKFSIQNNQNFKFINCSKKKNRYLLFKQYDIPEWQITSNSKNIKIQHLDNGFILIPLKEVYSEINFHYKNNEYNITFIFSIVILILISITLILTSKYKISLILISLILISKILISSKERILSIREIDHLEFKAFGQINFDKPNLIYKLNYWKKLDSTILVPQNKSKSDIEISFLEYFYPKTQENVLYNKRIYTIYNKVNSTHKIIYSKRNFKGNNKFKLNLKELLSHKNQSKNNVIGLKMIYKSDSNSTYKLWLSHSENGLWKDGKAWDISRKNENEEQKSKIILQYLDLSKFQLKINDELNLFIWSEENNLDFEIQEIEIFETNY